MKKIKVIMLAALLLAGCNNGQEKDGKATTDATETTEQITEYITEEPTTQEERNPAMEGETLFYDLYSHQEYEVMYRHIEEIMNEKLVSKIEEKDGYRLLPTDEQMIIVSDKSRRLNGVTINLNTGERLNLKDFNITPDKIRDMLEDEPDHVLSCFYLTLSKKCLGEELENEYYLEEYFIKGKRLYLTYRYNRQQFIYLGYDNVLKFD